MIQEPILFLTGAGASVDSGLGTYRGKGGLYERRGNPQEDLSIETWNKHPGLTWRTLGPLVNSIKKNKPGPTYELIKKISESHDVTIYTQNVDGYSHYACPNVWEMHGNVKTMKCEKCDVVYDLDEENPLCLSCNEYCKPNIVFYGENVRPNSMQFDKHKTVIVIGTTLEFSYLNRMLDKYKSRGALVIHVNPDINYGPVKNGDVWMRMKSEKALKLLFN